MKKILLFVAVLFTIQLQAQSFDFNCTEHADPAQIAECLMAMPNMSIAVNNITTNTNDYQLEYHSSQQAFRLFNRSAISGNGNFLLVESNASLQTLLERQAHLVDLVGVECTIVSPTTGLSLHASPTHGWVFEEDEPEPGYPYPDTYTIALPGSNYYLTSFVRAEGPDASLINNYEELFMAEQRVLNDNISTLSTIFRSWRNYYRFKIDHDDQTAPRRGSSFSGFFIVTSRQRDDTDHFIYAYLNSDSDFWQPYNGIYETPEDLQEILAIVGGALGNYPQ